MWTHLWKKLCKLYHIETITWSLIKALQEGHWPALKPFSLLMWKGYRRVCSWGLLKCNVMQSSHQPLSPALEKSRFPQTRRHAKMMFSLVGSTSICEQTFSLLTLNKSRLSWQQSLSPWPSITVPIRSDIYWWVKFNSDKIILPQIQVLTHQDSPLDLKARNIALLISMWSLAWTVWTPMVYSLMVGYWHRFSLDRITQSGNCAGNSQRTTLSSFTSLTKSYSLYISTL